MSNYIEVGLPELISSTENTLNGWVRIYGLSKRPVFIIDDPRNPKIIRVYMDNVCLRSELALCRDVKRAEGYSILTIHEE